MPTLYDTSTREPLELDGPALQDALAKGTASYKADDMVPVYSGDSGDAGVYQVPATKLQEALAQGFTVETPSQRAVRDYVDTPENQGASGALKVAAGQALNQAALGLPQIVYEKKGDPLEVAKWEALKKTHQLSNVLGGATGLAASFFMPGVSSLFKAGGAASEAVAKTIADKILVTGGEQLGERTVGQAAKQITGNLAANTAGKAIEGAIIASPQALTEAALGDPDVAGESLLYGALTGGAFGAAGTGLEGMLKGGKALGALLKPATAAGEEVASSPNNIAAKIAKTITGVSEDDVLEYARNSERINNIGNAYTQEGLKDEIDSHVKSFRDRALNTADAAKLAEDKLNQDYNNLKVQWSTAQAPREVADAIIGAQQSTKEQLGKMSDELFDTLSASPTTIPRDELRTLVQKQIDGLKLPGQAAGEAGAIFGKTAKTEASRLESLANDIKTLPEQIDMKTAKQLIKQLDPDLNFSYGAGEFNDFTNRHGKEFRKFLNDKLKDASPEAAVILNDMSTLSKSLSEANDKFGTIEKAIANTNNLFSPKGQLNRATLQKFGAMTGQDFLTPLSEYEQAKNLLKRAKTEDLRSEVLPEFFNQAQDLKSRAFVAQRDYEPISRLTEGRTQNIVKNQSGKSANIIDRKALETLADMTGKDYKQMIKDLSIYQGFYKEHTNGSRRAVWGHALGAILGPFGGAAGASAGAAMDVYGGQLLKRAIDKSDNFRGLLLAEQKMKDAAIQLDDIPNILGRMANRSGVTGSSMSLGAVERFVLNKDEPKKNQVIEARHENIKKLRENIIQFTSNQENAASKIGAITNLVSQQGAPNIGNALNQKMTTAISYLQNAIPKDRIPPNPLAPKFDYKPSDADIRKFERKLSVVQNPFSILKDLENGTLTRDHVQAIQAVYPKLYNEMQNKVFKAAANNEIPPMPYNKRITLSMFMGAPMDTSLQPQNILKFQQTFQQVDHSIDPQNKQQVDVAKGMQSEVQRIAGS